VTRCKLWVQNAACHTTVRADRICVLPVTGQTTGGDLYGPFHLEAVTADAVGQRYLAGSVALAR
jgi:hypothetical protein